WRYAYQYVFTNGLPPATELTREKYLAKHLASYRAIQFLNRAAGASHTVYSLFDPKVAYYAAGECIGDVFGPWRYRRVADKLEGDETMLFQELKSMDANYLLISDNSSGFGVKSDWLLWRHVYPIFRTHGVILFRVSELPHCRERNPELLGVDSL